ncbi:Z1 domain-containing protein [Clostridium butyricum]
MNSNIDNMVKYIQGHLSKYDWPLKDGLIEEKIREIRKMIELIDDSMVCTLLNFENYNKLSDSEWWSVQRELETINIVKNKPGTILVGKNSKKRDNRWWTDKSKQISDSYYWNRYSKYLEMETKLPFEVRRSLDVDTDQIMNYIENPDLSSFSNFGMVVGHVQSGKTGNYTGLICKAADAGYKLIVIIAGAMNNLRTQTQERINENFVGIEGDKFIGVSKITGLINNRTPKSLTTLTDDFNKNDIIKFKQLINFDKESEPVVMVIKKNTNSLDSVNQWLKNKNNEKILHHAMLLIDDESDYASINTKQDEITTINYKIRALLNKFEKSSYVAYTATPYANIFIDHNSSNQIIGEDLFPKDFIYLLEAPENYFGAKKIFINESNKYVVEIDEPCEIPRNHKKDDIFPNLPESMKEAIRQYIINVGIRGLRSDSNKHHSMLIHATRFTRFHMQITVKVEAYLKLIREEVTLYGHLKDSYLISQAILDLKETFYNTFSKYPIKEKWEDIIISITDNIKKIIVREVHGEKSLDLEYRKDEPTYAIVIGGTSLSRGYTIEGLSVSYFYRNSNYYDTLLQMARWFGYRNNYEDICRIYMTSEMKDKFATITTYTEELYEDFREMGRQKKTPEEFGLAVKQHPGSALMVTARNKSRNTKDIIIEMTLDGSLKETSWLLKDSSSIDHNYNLLVDLINKLIETNKTESIGSTKLWRNTDKKFVREFIERFKTYSRDAFDILSRMPINCIIDYIEQYDFTWDIALYSGELKPHKIANDLVIKKEKRILHDKGNYYEVHQRQVSSGNSEAVALDDTTKKICGNSRKKIRINMDNPLLMLHVIESEQCEKIVAFGVSFPGGVEKDKKLVMVKANSVMIENLKKELEDEEYDD